MDPIRIPTFIVPSSQIAAIGHDPETNTMAVRFKSASSPLYHYNNISTEEFTAFKSAESIGSYFYKNIKPFADKFPFTKINETKEG